MGTWELSVYPPSYGDPFYRGRGSGRGRGRGGREPIGERPFDRDLIRGFGRSSFQGFGRGNGRGFYSQRPFRKRQKM